MNYKKQLKKSDEVSFILNEPYNYDCNKINIPIDINYLCLWDYAAFAIVKLLVWQEFTPIIFSPSWEAWPKLCFGRTEDKIVLRSLAEVCLDALKIKSFIEKLFRIKKNS